jgi:hypothetical protein
MLDLTMAHTTLILEFDGAVLRRGLTDKADALARAREDWAESDLCADG